MSIERARTLRRNATDAERRLWRYLRAKQLEGFRFRRQVPIGRYVADFACLSARLIVELDGSQHAERMEYDGERTEWLEAQEFRVLRFWNNDVVENVEGVVEQLLVELRTPHPTLPRTGGGKRRAGGWGESGTPTSEQGR